MDNVTAIVVSFAGFEGTQEVQQLQQLSQMQQLDQPTLDKKFEATSSADQGQEAIEKTSMTYSPLKTGKKQLELDDYGLSQEKQMEEFTSYQKMKSRINESGKGQFTGGKNYRNNPLLPDLKSVSTNNIYGQNSRMIGGKGTISPRSGL